MNLVPCVAVAAASLVAMPVILVAQTPPPAYAFVELNPPGATYSFVADAAGGRQVRYFYAPATAGKHHAALWNGSAGSVVDLHPAGYDRSFGFATDGAQQVGSARAAATGDDNHAIVWSGSAASAVDLHPAGFRDSEAESVWGGRQVGYGYHAATEQHHALLWSGKSGAPSTSTRRASCLRSPSPSTATRSRAAG